MIIQPKIFDSSTIIAAQSTRLGGVSPEPFNSMNLGLSVNDEEHNVWKNRELFFEKIGVELSKVSRCYQVHGNDVLIVNEPVSNEKYDAQISNKSNVYLAVSIADCTPVLIHDEKENAIAAIHAGWKGTVGEIVSKTLFKMQEHFGTTGENCKAYIGACIGYENFEVGDEVAAHFDQTLKRFDKQKQKWFVDLKRANQKQLLDFGIHSENIEISTYCTVQNNDLFFSHRKEKGVTGRMMAVIGMKQL